MFMLRNRLLGTTSFLLGPNDSPNGGDGTGNDPNDAGGQNGSDTGADAGGDAGADTGAASGEDGGDAAGDGAAGTDGGNSSTSDEGDDEDEDLADLPPEVRDRVKRRIEKETAWRDRQINRLHRQKRERDEDVEALEVIADPARRSQQSQTPAGQQDDPNRRFTAEEVQTEAQRIAAQNQYDRDANATDERGQEIYGSKKWGDRLARIPKMGGVPQQDMALILATDKPHVVLYHLGDPDTFERIMALPPARRNNEFVKLALKDEPQPAARPTKESARPGNAPAPMKPVNGGRQTAAQGVDLYKDDTADDAWYNERNRTRRKKFSNVE